MSETEVQNWLRVADAALRQKADNSSANRGHILTEALERLDQPIMNMAVQLSSLQDRLARQDRRDVFRWLSSIPYNSHFDQNAKGLVPRSGQWLLKSREFLEWSSTSDSSFLWLKGTLGSGKTSLVSIVLQSLRSYGASASDACPVAFFYCSRNTAEPERADPDKILSALLKQLSGSDPDEPIRIPVADEYKRRKAEAGRDCSEPKSLDVEDCTKLITELCDANPAFIVVDALDECDPQRRYELLEALDTIATRSKEIVKVFLSSRDDIDIRRHIQLSRVFESHISEEKNGEDIDSYIRKEVDRLNSKGLLLGGGSLSKRLRRKTVATLSERAQGMFRWAALSLETLTSHKHPRDYEKALGTLPDQLSQLYDMLYAEIMHSGESASKLATMTLTLLMYSRRLLSSDELLAAVSEDTEVEDQRGGSSPELESVSDGESSSAESSDAGWPDIISSAQLVNICRNFVVIDLKQDVFRFAHPSVREFLERHPDYSFEEFYYYAAKWWLYHYREACTRVQETKIQEKLHEFLFQGPGMEPSHSYAVWSGNEQLKWDRSEVSFLRDLHLSSATTLAVSFGSLPMIEGFMCRKGFDPSLPTESGKTPLHLAAWNGHFSVVELFLTHLQLPPEPRDGSGRTPLHLASMGRYKSIAELLLSRGADFNAQDSVGRTALHHAAEWNAESVLELLLSRGADPEIKDGWGSTPLHKAATDGYKSITELLLSWGANRNTQDDNGLSPLHLAIDCRREGVAGLLLSRGANHDVRDNHGRTPLHLASRKRYEPIVELLLSRGADPNARDDDGQTPLHVAGREGYEPVVELLLSRGGDPGLRDLRGCTPLFQAALSRHKRVVDRLLEAWMANVADPIDHQGFDRRSHFFSLFSSDPEPYDCERIVLALVRTDSVGTPRTRVENSYALSKAAAAGMALVVQELQMSDEIDVNELDDRGQTPLYNAVVHGHAHVVRILLANPAINPNVPNRWKDTPLLGASSDGNIAMVNALLRRPDINPNKGGEYGTSPLMKAAMLEDNSVVIKRLLAHPGIQINQKNGLGQTALHFAPKAGNQASITILVDHGADANAQDKSGRTPLSIAAGRGYENSITVLLAIDKVDPNRRDRLGRSPLSWSVARSDKPVRYIAPDIKAAKALLADSRVEVNLRDKDGRTALSLAAEEGFVEIVKVLTESDEIDIDLADNEGRTPLQWARLRGHHKLASLLKSKRKTKGGMPP
ncbi:hypothetical protein VTK73DRAFT_8855 [Phialemonium thermophilum]|uniref:Nephrocystin 3-like N-terminal domain-containing protein n=1 Tax=Phialemonium thermophilum TaxID=223376 RepID=A0ABR3W605_9PEZI